MKGSLEERFWAKVQKGEECWEWAGAKSPNDYGKIFDGGKFPVAHRVSFVLAFGEIPEGMELDHLCRNRGCVRPSHLEPVTSQENIRRSRTSEAQRSRHAAVTHCPRGHSYDAENTYYASWKGLYVIRACRTCQRSRRAAAYQQAKRAAKAAATNQGVTTNVQETRQ